MLTKTSGLKQFGAFLERAGMAREKAGTLLKQLQALPIDRLEFALARLDQMSMSGLVGKPGAEQRLEALVRDAATLDQDFRAYAARQNDADVDSLFGARGPVTGVEYGYALMKLASDGELTAGHRGQPNDRFQLSVRFEGLPSREKGEALALMLRLGFSDLFVDVLRPVLPGMGGARAENPESAAVRETVESLLTQLERIGERAEAYSVAPAIARQGAFQQTNLLPGATLYSLREFVHAYAPESEVRLDAIIGKDQGRKMTVPDED